MFDFRYHALTLAAVFLALTVGLLLGVAIGDRGLVSGAERDVRSSLRDDVKAAESRAARLRAGLDQRAAFEREAYPLLVNSRLAGRRVALLELGGVDNRIVQLTRQALDGSGGRLSFVGVLREPADLQALSRKARGTRYAALASQPELAERLGERVGTQLVRGGRLVARVARALLSNTSGDLGRFDAVVLSRSPRRLRGAAARPTADLERGLVKGLTSRDADVVGVQTTDAGASQTAWYREHGMSAVDDLDDVLGRAALILALAGEEGSFGLRGDALLPPAVSP